MPKDPVADSHAAKLGDSVAVAKWRERMGHEDAKRVYRECAATAGRVNALARNRGLIQLRVQCINKVRCVLLFHALVQNLMRTLALAPELLGFGIAAPTVVAIAT